MRLLTLTLAAALTAGSTVALAAAPMARMSDASFIQLGRCAGLAKASGADDSAFTNAMRANRRGREDITLARANTARETAGTLMRRASGDARERLTQELGTCNGLI